MSLDPPEANTRSLTSVVKKFILLLLTAICTACILAVVGYWTTPYIQSNRESLTQEQLVIVQGLVDAKLKESFQDIPTPQTCETQPIILKIIERGYGGDMEVIVGFTGNQVAVLRVGNHSETPGFAEILDPSNWIGLFGSQPIHEFDAVTRTTITSRAVLRAVNKAITESNELVNSCLTS